jgi:hypothetical protein
MLLGHWTLFYEKHKGKMTNNDAQNIHMKLNIEYHESHQQLKINWDASEGWAVISLQVTSVVLIYLHTRW